MLIMAAQHASHHEHTSRAELSRGPTCALLLYYKALDPVVGLAAAGVLQQGSAPAASWGVRIAAGKERRGGEPPTLKTKSTKEREEDVFMRCAPVRASRRAPSSSASTWPSVRILKHSSASTQAHSLGG